jgi:hypothetical protein
MQAISLKRIPASGKIPPVRGGQDDDPPWELRWWFEVENWFEANPEFAHQREAAERWRDQVLRDPYSMPFEAIIEDQQVCFSIPEGVDAGSHGSPWTGDRPRTFDTSTFTRLRDSMS